MLDSDYRFPEEVIALLIDIIPRINKSKRSVIEFFRGCAVPEDFLTDLEQRLRQDKKSINKFEIARTVLSSLQLSGELGLRSKREIIKQATEFESFENLWPNDQASARGYISQLKEIINKKDSFTRLQQKQREEEERRRQIQEQERLNEIREKRQEKSALNNRFMELFGESNSIVRGQKLEHFLNDYFKYEEILVRESFTIVGQSGEGIVQQIDGAIEVNNHLYLIEVKWWSKPLGPSDVSQHVMRLYQRDPAIRGIFIAASGYTAAALQDLEKALSDRLMVVFSLREISLLLEKETEFIDLLEKKVLKTRTDKTLTHDDILI